MNISNVFTPEMVPLPKAPMIFGLSRSALYRLASSGHIKLLKVGARTLVDANSVRQYLSELPEANIRRDPHRIQCNRILNASSK
jgi:hypothetical protein